MKIINTNTLEKNLFPILQNVIHNDEDITIHTKTGNVVILTEQKYKNLSETIYLSSNLQTKSEIKDGLLARENDCIPSNNVLW